MAKIKHGPKMLNFGASKPGVVGIGPLGVFRISNPNSKVLHEKFQI